MRMVKFTCFCDKQRLFVDFNDIHFDTVEGLVVINKPFGVGVINAKSKLKGKELHHSHLRGVPLPDYNLEMALPKLRLALDKPELVLVKSTEK